MHTTDFDPASLAPALSATYQHWQVVRRKRDMPRLSDIRMPHLSGPDEGLAVSEALRNDAGDICDFRVVFLSSGLRPDHFRAFMGKKFSELQEKEPGSNLWQAYENCLRLKQPVWAMFDYIGPDPEITHANAILLPLCCDRDCPSYVLSCAVFLSR